MQTSFARLTWLCIALLVASNTVQAGAMLLHIGRTSPRMGQRGTTVDVVIQGVCLKDAKEIIFYRPGIRAVSIGEPTKLASTIGLHHGGRIEEQILCKFEIDSDCQPGEYPFRIRTATELTSLGTFHVTPFPVIEENEPGYNTNDQLQDAMVVPLNVTILGRLGAGARGDVDLYKVPVVVGQRLSVEVDSVRIADAHYGGSEYDVALRILDENGRELAANDDNRLHLQDPMVSIKVPEPSIPSKRNSTNEATAVNTTKGDIHADDTLHYVYVEVQRSLFVSDDRPYCVHIGSNRLATVVFPGGGRPDATKKFRFLGDPLGDFYETLKVPHDPGTFCYWGNAASPLCIRSSELAEYIEQVATEDSNAPLVSWPVSIHGVISKREEIDKYRLRVKQDDRLRIRVYAASLGSPIDPKIKLIPLEANDSPGAAEIEADDSTLVDRDIFGTSFRGQGGQKDILDPSILWEPKRSGDYLLTIEDTDRIGGRISVYRIEIESADDSMYTVLNSTAFDWMECPRTSGLAVPQGNRWTVNLSLSAGLGNAYRGEFDLIAHGLPEGVRMISPRVPAGRTLWPVQFVADRSTTTGAWLIDIDAKPVGESRKFFTASQQQIPFINHPGGDAWRTVMLDKFVLAVTEPSPFSIELSIPSVDLVRGSEIAIPVRVKRNGDFNGPIEFQSDWYPPGITIQPALVIPSDQSEAVMKVACDANAPLGLCPLVVVATTINDFSDGYLGVGRIRVSSEFIHVNIAETLLELASQPSSVRRMSTSAFRWTVSHKNKFQGTAKVKLIGLPKGVYAVEPLPEITSETESIVFQIQATEDALLGSVNGLECEVTFVVQGQEIHQRTGHGTLRVDPARE